MRIYIKAAARVLGRLGSIAGAMAIMVLLFHRLGGWMMGPLRSGLDHVMGTFVAFGLVLFGALIGSLGVGLVRFLVFAVTNEARAIRREEAKQAEADRVAGSLSTTEAQGGEVSES